MYTNLEITIFDRNSVMQKAAKALGLPTYGQTEIVNGLKAEYFPWRRPRWRQAMPTIYECEQIEFEVDIFEDGGNCYQIHFHLFACEDEDPEFEYVLVSSDTQKQIGVFCRNAVEARDFVLRFVGDKNILKDYANNSNFGMRNLVVFNQ